MSIVKTTPLPTPLKNTYGTLTGTTVLLSGDGKYPPVYSSRHFPVGTTSYEYASGYYLRNITSLEGTGGSISNDPTEKGNYNPVTHITESYTMPLTGETTRTGSVVRSSGSSTYSISLQSNFRHSADGSDMPTHRNTFLSKFDESATSIENAKSSAWGKVSLTTRTSGFNLPQFVGELRDFKDVFGEAVKGIRKLMKPDLLPQVRRIELWLGKPIKKRWAIGDYLRAAVAMDLSIQFILKPLLSDLKAMSNFENHLDYQIVQLNLGKLIVSHGTHHEQFEYSIDDSDPLTWLLRDIKGTVQRTVTATYAYKRAKGGSITPLSARMEALGFNRPLSVAWELMRWSFAADYVIGIGESIAQMEQQLLNLLEKVDHEYSGTSVKTVVSLGVYGIPWDTIISNAYADGDPSGGATGYYSYTNYSREVGGAPGAFAPPVLKLPSFRQLRNLADIAFLRKFR